MIYLLEEECMQIKDISNVHKTCILSIAYNDVMVNLVAIVTLPECMASFLQPLSHEEEDKVFSSILSIAYNDVMVNLVAIVTLPECMASFLQPLSHEEEDKVFSSIRFCNECT